MKQRAMWQRCLLWGILGLVVPFTLVACRQAEPQPLMPGTTSARLDSSGGEVELNDVSVKLDSGFLVLPTTVVLSTSDQRPDSYPESAAASYPRSAVTPLAPAATVIIPYDAIDFSGSFAERSELRVRIPAATGTSAEAETFAEVRVRLADGDELFYLQPYQSATSAEPDGDVVTLSNLQLKQVGSNTAGTVAVTVQPVIAEPESGVVAPQGIPSGFVLEDVVTDLNQGVVFDFAPDERIFIGEKGGVVRVADGGTLLPEPFIDISAQVNSRHDRGLLGLAVHPEFPAQPYVYLLFTYDPPEVAGGSEAGGPDGNGARVSRLTRVTADAAQGYAKAKANSEVVLLGTNSTYANIGDPNLRNGPPSCVEGDGYVRDCLPADEQSHTIGTLRFGTDGSLFVGNGDGANYTKVEPYAARALDLDSLAGKILRIDPSTGAGYADNPFYNGNADSNRAKVYSLGLRNPFRFTVDPRSGEPLVGDVGWSTWEEVNRGRGSNFGWPCYEGGDGESLRQGSYAALDVCQDLYASGAQVSPGAYAYVHVGGSSVQVGDVYTGDSYPAAYRGVLFISDFNQEWIRTLSLGADGRVTGVEDFGTEAGLVQVSSGPGGDLYLMNIYEGKLKRLRYTRVGNAPPTVTVGATPTGGGLPLEVAFSSTGTSDPDGDALTYAWTFGDGASSSEVNPTHTYTEPGVYQATLTVTDTAGAAAAASVTVEAGSDAPTATILSPADGTTYRVGDTLTFEGSGVDLQDGELSGNSLSWTLRLNHNDHTHPDGLPPTTGSAGSFTAPDHGDNTSLTLCLTATDSSGNKAISCISLAPETVTYTLATEPSGLELSWEGITRTTPFTVETNINAEQTLTALAEQDGLTFDSWSDGGERVHTITVADTPQTLTATYTDPSPPPTGEGSRYLRLVAESEVNGRPWTSVAELNLVDSTGNLINQGGWRVQSFDSQETQGEDGRASNAIDGNPGTFWHTAWSQGNPPHPHEIVIDLGGFYKLSELRYLPRQGGNPNGRVARYKLYSSRDGTSWGSPVAAGTFVNSSQEQRVSLTGGAGTSDCGGLETEAEAGTLFGAFRRGNSSSASGGSYVHLPNGTGNAYDAPNRDNRVEYCLTVPNAGSYRIKARVYTPNGNDNSFFVAVDGAPAQGYLWDTRRSRRYQDDFVAQRGGADPVTFALGAGEHTLIFYGREDGTRLDRVALERVN